MSVAAPSTRSGVRPEPATSVPASEQAGLSSDRYDSEVEVVVEADNDKTLETKLHMTLTADEYSERVS